MAAQSPIASSVLVFINVLQFSVIVSSFVVVHRNRSRPGNSTVPSFRAIRSSALLFPHLFFELVQSVAELFEIGFNAREVVCMGGFMRGADRLIYLLRTFLDRSFVVGMDDLDQGGGQPFNGFGMGMNVFELFGRDSGLQFHVVAMKLRPNAFGGIGQPAGG